MKKIVLMIIGTLVSLSVNAEGPNLKTTTETYQDWQIACVEQGDLKRCEMKQSLANQAGQPVAVLSVAKQSKDSFLMQVVLPHLTDLTKKVKVSVDDKEIASLPYSFCNQVACFVRIDNNKKFLNELKKGKAGVVEAGVINDGELIVNFSLKGFSSAYTNLKRNL